MITVDFEHCTGCGACVQVCPKKCIQNKENSEGFVYPVINVNDCINCNLCEKVCPIRKSQELVNPKAYAAVNRNIDSLLKASSGGVFDSIARYALKYNGIVYGCAFSDDLKAKHIRIDCINNLHMLYGSKYVQSDIANTYSKVKKDLNAGRLVVFSGTPCQVAGLKSFLNKQYENLITVDIICHGVPSQAYFDKYIGMLRKRHQGNIVDFNFRSKDNHGWSLAGDFACVKHNEKKKHSLFYFDNYYYHYFLESSIYRRSCYTCKYANLNREGDFSLGDLWGAERFNFDFDTSRGCSLLLVNTNKGSKILKYLYIDISEIDIETAVQYNAQLSHPSVKPACWEKRIDDFKSKSAQEIQSDYLREYRTKRIMGRLKYLVPSKVVKVLNIIRYKFNVLARD